jgi:hypothetical protein
MYYCMILTLYIEDNMPIQRHVIMTDVTRTVLLSKCTFLLDVMLKHHHARQKFQEYENSGR